MTQENELRAKKSALTSYGKSKMAYSSGAKTVNAFDFLAGWDAAINFSRTQPHQLDGELERNAFEEAFCKGRDNEFRELYVEHRFDNGDYEHSVTQAFYDGWKLRCQHDALSAMPQQPAKFTEAELVEIMWKASRSEVRVQSLYLEPIDMQDALRALIAAGAIQVKE